jgi:predicted ATPase/DNA-binding CsgD family transcriptional regulator
MAVAGTKPSKGNLPLEVTSFVGRQIEVADVRRLLSTSRLVTLTGTGGVGKTRLALHVAAQVHRAFSDGVWLADLGPLRDEALVSQTVAAALRIPDESARWPVAALSEYLADKQLLLVMDNCEHLIGACAVLADALLQAAPGLRILSTSRQAYGLPAEHTLSIAPLRVPDPDMPTSVAELAACDAVTLFVDRAHAVSRDFALTSANAPVVAQLCRRLDGLPLALELAAPRLRALSPEQILERLDERHPELRATNPAAPARQQTLHALVDWSFELCSPDERTLWARVSVFADPFDLEAVEEVCAGDGLSREAIVDLVIGLVEKSVLFRLQQGSPVRYRLLDTIRVYGLQRLAATGAEATLRRRHRDYYQRRAERAETSPIGPDQMAWIARVRGDHANLRAALDFSLAEPGEAKAGLLLAATLWYHWHAAGLVSEGRRWLDRLLARATEPTLTRAKALLADAWLAIIQGDLDAATRMLEESGNLGREFGDESVVAYTAQFRGQAAMYRGDLAQAATLLEQALSRHRATDNAVGVGMTQIRLALTLSLLGRSERTVELVEEILTEFESLDAPWWKAYAHWVLAVEMWQRNDLEHATSLARASLRVNRDFDDRLGAALAVEVLAWTAASQGQADRAALLFGALQQAWRRLGGPLSGFGYLGAYRDRSLATTRDKLGDTAFHTAFADGAQLTFDETLTLALDEQPDTTASARTEEREAPLTRREQEIADLIAQGMSNKEIANRLVIAQRTAEGHVEHILTKLGFNSRAQIAVWVSQHQNAAVRHNQSAS